MIKIKSVCSFQDLKSGFKTLELRPLSLAILLEMHELNNGTL
jgi:hypothetical protein